MYIYLPPNKINQIGKAPLTATAADPGLLLFYMCNSKSVQCSLLPPQIRPTMGLLLVGILKKIGM